MTHNGACWRSDCDGQQRLLLDGTTYCKTCEYIADSEITDIPTDQYDDTVAELIDADFREVRKEFMAGVDLYCTGTLGFPDEASYKRFTAVLMLYVVRLTTDVADRVDENERRVQNIQSKLWDLEATVEDA